MGRGDLGGAAHLQLISGVVHLRPEDAMVEAMLKGWRAQQAARGLQEDTIVPRERLVRRFVDFTGEYPWNWGVNGRIVWLTLVALFGSLGADDEDLPGGVDDVGDDRVKLVDAHDAGDLGHEAFDEAEVAAGDLFDRVRCL